MNPRLNLIPTNISNDFAKLNQAVLHPDTFAKLKIPKQDRVYVKVKDFILNCGKAQEIPPDRLGLSKRARDFVYVNMTDPVAVEAFLIPIDRETGLSYIEFELQLQATVQPQEAIEIDDQKLATQLKKSLADSFFRARQSIYINFEQYLLAATVNKVELIEIGAKEGSANGDKIGRIVDQTEIVFTIKQGEKLRTLKGPDDTVSLFRPDFKISDMGIGGLGDELANIFRRAFASRRFPPGVVEKLGIKHIKGILLYGPPGTGKTLIARQLGKYLKAKEFRVVNGPQIFSKYVGESEENVRKLFDKARDDEESMGPASPLHIIVFDEFDALVKQRGSSSGGSNAGDLVVNQLLTQIDGVKALNNILVIGMTNRKDLIDEAVLRPGRLEVHIEISLPNEEGRQEILKIHTQTLQKNNLLGKTVDLQKMSRMTNNYTGAEIEGIVKSASSFAMTRQSTVMDFSKEVVINDNIQIEMEDFEKALGEIRPQFGVDEEKFDTFLRGKIYDYGSRFKKITDTLGHSIEITKTGTSSQLNSVILEGQPGTGKTSIAAHFARQCSFPFVKLISPQNFVGYTTDGKINAMVQIFENAYKSTHACIILDDLERLIEFIDIGPRFNNNVLQSLLVLINRLPKNAECRLLLIGTTSCYEKLSQLELSQSFNIRTHVPRLNPDEVYKMLLDLNVQTADAKEIGKSLGGVAIKQFLQIKEMAKGQSVQGWNAALEVFKEIQLEI